MTMHTKLSKFLSMVLRHRAHEFGLELDSEGYTDIGALYEVVQGRYKNAYTYDDMIRVLTTPGSDHKLRFELVGYRVRARYGHNKAVTAIEYPPAVPPEQLYHGTVAAALDGIRKDGLQAQARQYVHLAVDVERALTVGGRRGTAVLLIVRAKAAHDAGFVFYQPDDEHFLVSEIPPAYIDFPE